MPALAAAEVEHGHPRPQVEAVVVDGQHGASLPFEDSAYQSAGPLRRRPPGVGVQHPPPAGAAELLGERRGVQHQLQRGGQLADVPGPDPQPGLVPTTSGRAPASVVTSGVAQAMASTAGSEKPS